MADIIIDQDSDDIYAYYTGDTLLYGPFWSSPLVGVVVEQAEEELKFYLTENGSDWAPCTAEEALLKVPTLEIVLREDGTIDIDLWVRGLN